MARSRSKYGNKRVEYMGFAFDSIAERNRYIHLFLREKAGDIKDLELQPTYILLKARPKTWKGPARRALKYIADFAYLERRRPIVETGAEDGEGYEWWKVAEDVKGYATGVFKIKQRLMEEFVTDVELRVIAA